MNKFYTGVGSREIPEDIEESIVKIAEFLAKKGYTLRSGAADGADAAFERGCDKVNGAKEIYLPWKGFNNHKSLLSHIPACWPVAAQIHPNWKNLDCNARCLHARNCNQVLGKDLLSPSAFLIAYTEDGIIQGGTATAIRLAKQHGIPVFNLGFKNGLDNLREFCKTL
jgi:hypothetical protein